MPFKFFQSMSFSGQPSVSTLRSVYNIFGIYTTTGAFVGTSNLSINTTKINQSVDFAISQGYNGICWNEQGSNISTFRPGITDSEIDAILDAIKTIYDISKARAISMGKPELLIGFYDIPGLSFDNYYGPIAYNTNSSSTNAVNWSNWIDRLNKRKINGVYTVVPFSGSFDFIAPEVNPLFGNDSSSISEWKIFAETKIQQMTNRLSDNKPVYPFFTMSFNSSERWNGILVDSNHMTESLNMIKSCSDGVILFGGLDVGYQYGKYRWRPSGANETADLVAWTSVSDGSFSISLNNEKFKITGINTTAASGMNSVALTLQTAIRAKVDSGVTFDNYYPVPVGLVTVEWNSAQKSFLFSIANHSSYPQPPNFSAGAINIFSKNYWGADNTSSTDLGTNQFLGVPTINNSGLPGNQQWIYVGTKNNQEWQFYAENQPWWEVFSEQSSSAADIKDFKYFFWTNCTGMPDVKTFKDDYCVDFMQTGDCVPFTTGYDNIESYLSVGTLEVDDSAINAMITEYLDPDLGDNQKKYYAYDIKNFAPYFDKTLYSDVIIDNMLESCVNVYNRTKSLLQARGISDVKIGFYLAPAFKDYNAPVQYSLDKGNVSQSITDYNNWVDKFKRINLRKSGSSYITKKFSDSVDFVTCEVFPLYGEEDLSDDCFFKENILQTSRYLSGDKPLYVFIRSVFDPSTYWSGKAVSETYMLKMISWVKRIANGVVLWTFSNPSYKGARQRHFMTSQGGPPAVAEKTLADWQSITNGCFSYFAVGFNRAISGIDFSAATSIGGAESTSVANILETAINNDLYYIENFIGNKPYSVGFVTVSYNSDTSDNSPSDLTRVPCFEFTYVDASLESPPDSNSYTGRDFIYCYSNASGGGTDIGVADWIGTYIYTDQEYNSNYYSGEDVDSDEFNNGWIVSTKWWDTFSSMAISDSFSQSRDIRYTESINDQSPASDENPSFTFTTKKPKPNKMKSLYNIDTVYVAYVAVNVSLSSVASPGSGGDYPYIQYHLNRAINEGDSKVNIFVWDIEGPLVDIDYATPGNEAAKDVILDGFKNVYNKTKERLALMGRSDIKIGFYGCPFGNQHYYGGMYWGNPSLYAAFFNNGISLRDSLIRINQRFINNTFVSSPCTEWNDIFFPSFYKLSGGYDDAEEAELYSVIGSMKMYLETCGLSKPYYPFITHNYLDLDGLNTLIGHSVDSKSQKYYKTMLENGVSGFLMWSAGRWSITNYNHRFTPTAAASDAAMLARWTSLGTTSSTKPYFAIAVEGYTLLVSENLDFSSATSMNDVASILQNSINARIAETPVVPDSFSWSVNGSSPTIQVQRSIGDVTVTWNSSSKKFIMNSYRGLYKDPVGFISPPDLEKSYFKIVTPGSNYIIPDRSTRTDIGTSFYIGSHAHYSDFSTTPQISDEWNTGWVEYSTWWNIYRSYALGKFGTNLENRVVPFINLVTASSGDFPFTVHVDACSSFFNGIDPQDCIFEWDFGDSNPTSVAKRNLVSDGRCDTDLDADGGKYLGTSLSNKQRGINASYTYWHNNGGVPFTIKLKVWHNGASSDAVYQNITVTTPSVVNYPTNDLSKWVLVQVMPGELTPSGSEFQTLNSAINWIEANRPYGKVIVEIKAGVSGEYKIPISSKIVVNKPNIIFRSIDPLVPAQFVGKNGSLSRVSPIELFEISQTAYNIYFQDVQFGSTSNISGDSVGYEQGSDLTSNLIGCSIKTPSSEIPFVHNITFSNCYFRNLYQAINTSHFVTGVYLNQCVSGRTKIKSFDFIGSNIVMNACSHSFAFDTKTGTSLATDSIVNFGRTEGLSEKFSMNFCDLRYNSYLDNTDGIPNRSSGSVYIKNARYVFICSSILDKGSNYIDDCFSVRFDKNIINSEGLAYGLVITSPCSYITVVNNCFNINQYNTIIGNAILDAGAIDFSGTSGLINKVKIVNNNFVVRDNIRYNKSILDFTAPTGTSLLNIEFVNNLCVENASLIVSKWISVDGISGQFSNFAYNIWPLRQGDMSFAFVGGSLKDWNYWNESGIDLDSQQVDVLISDMLMVYRNRLLLSIYPRLQDNQYFHPAASRDFNDEVRDYSHTAPGSSLPIISNILPTGDMIVTSFYSTRVRSSETSWTPPSSQNLYISVTDPFVQTLDSSLQNVSKPIYKAINSSVNNLIDFTPVEVRSNVRAFRVKIDTKYSTSYKDAYFAIVDDGGVNKFVGRFKLSNDTMQDLISLVVSSYTTTQDLVDAIYNQGRNVLGIEGFKVENFGSQLTSTLDNSGTLSSFHSVVDSYALSSIYDQGSGDTYDNIHGFGRWAWAYFDILSSQVKFGNYINTTFSVTPKSDGYDVVVTYTNDGPTTQSWGDPRQRIGYFYIDGFLVGNKFGYVDTQYDSSVVLGESLYENYNGVSREYPFSKFSLTNNVIGQTYSSGVSIKYNQILNPLQVEEVTESKNNSVTSRFRWATSIQSDDLSIVNKDCLRKNETFQFTISVRITRDVRNWVQTLEPYKSYFAQTFGGVSFVKDPRPIKINNLAEICNSRAFGYNDYVSVGNQDPSIYGWAWWSNKIKDNYITQGYERQLIYNFAGLYGNGNVNNNPFFMLAPLFDISNEFPHSSSGPHVDTNFNCPGSGVFTNNPQLLKGTVYMIRDAIQEVPSVGLYQGHGTQIHRKWEPEINEINKAVDALSGNSLVIDFLLNELDLSNYYLKANCYGLDAFSRGFDTLFQGDSFLNFAISNYSGTKFLLNQWNNDISCTKSSIYLTSSFNNIPLSGPNIVADYLLSGNEICSIIDMSDISSAFPLEQFSFNVLKNRMAALARWGYVVGTINDDSGISSSSSIYKAVDRKFVFDTKPASYIPLSSPSNIKHSIFDKSINNKYADLKNHTISLFWNMNTEPDFSHYIIYKAPVVNGIVDQNRPYQIKAYVKTSSFYDNQVFPGKTYYYKIAAVDYDGNVSGLTSYQVTHIADNPVLNPPLNVSATSEIEEGKVLVAWSDPSSSFLPSSEMKSPPKVIIQGSTFSSIEFSSPLFDLSFVYPLVTEAISFDSTIGSYTDNRTMEARAVVAADKITLIRNNWLAVRPNTPFRYAFGLQNFGTGWGNSGSATFYHDSDRLSTSSGLVNCLWTYNGRVESKAKMRTYFSHLSSVLRSRGIPDPIYIDAGYNLQSSLAGGNWLQRLNWHGWLMADSRSTTELFDGYKTYSSYISNLKDIDNQSIPSNQLYPSIDAVDSVSTKRVHVFSSINSMVVDYGLWDTVYSTAKEVWPNVKCGNNSTFVSSRETLVHSSRFINSPVDCNVGFRGDYSVPTWYGFNIIDYNSWALGSGFMSYNECVSRYSVNTSVIKDPSSIMRALEIGQWDYFCKGSQLANSNKPISPWMTYQDYPIVYNNIHESDSVLYYPDKFNASLIYNKDHVMNIFRIFNKYNVQQVGFYLGQSVSGSAESNLVLYSKIYSVLSSLQEAGYVL